MDRFDRQTRIDGWGDQQALAKARVLLVGAGTTGNEIAKNLALVGIGHCDIVDNDIVEEVNLSRCAMFVRDDIGQSKSTALARRVELLAPEYAQFQPFNLDLVEEFGSARYQDYCAVISAVDNLEARAWLNRYCRLNRTTFIDTGIGGLNWQITVVPASSSACLECGWGSAQYERLAERHSCSRLGLVQDTPVIPMVITTAAQVGGLTVEILSRILHGDYGSSEVRTWTRQGKYDTWLTWTTPERQTCGAHHWDPVTDVLKGDINLTVAELAAEAAQHLRAEHVELSLDRPIVLTAACRRCGHEQKIEPVALSRFRRLTCSECHWFDVVPSTISEILPGFVRPTNVGVPDRQYLRVSWLDGDSVRATWMLVE